jgi:hypothetical protein
MQTGWYSKDLGDALMAHLELAQIAAAGHAALAERPGLEDFAVFMRHSSEGRLQCAVTVYFTPAAGALASQHQAMRCRIPDRDGLELLCGDADSWRLLADPVD